MTMEVGDHVEEGTPLVILETDELKAQLAQARAAAAAAAANLEANKQVHCHSSWSRLRLLNSRLKQPFEC